MKLFYISLFMSISLLVIGVALSIEQKNEEPVVQTELVEGSSTIENCDEVQEQTVGQIILKAITAIFVGISLAVIIFFLFAVAVIVWDRFFEIIL